MKLKYFLPFILLLVFTTACKQTDPDNRSGLFPAIGERMQMAPFEAVSLTDKKTLNSKHFEGKVLLVTFFATWCPPCIQEIPTLIDLQDKFKSKGFSVLAFSVDEPDVDHQIGLINKYSINNPVFLEDPVVTRSFGGVTGIPVTFLVNRKGEIVKKYLGYVEHDILKDKIGKMLKAG
jgi:thiol-disulfide isomerase/thioredoxin